MTDSAPTQVCPPGPVLFAYDGSELAALAIAEAGQLLRPERDALVVCVWQPFDVGFVTAEGEQFNAEQTPQVKAAAERAAAKGAALAEAAGFKAESVAIEAAPIWKAIVKLADERDVSVIVLGSHGRSGLVGKFVGSVAAAVSAHSSRAVLITHRHD
jgi:nucleotide-binding universal stress UspA family protein